MSNGISNLEQRIAQFETLLAQMREEVREAHSTLKQLRREHKEIEHLLTTDVKEMMNDRISEIVKTELDKLGPGIREQSNLIYEKVGQQMDKLIDISMGKEFSKQHGRQDLRPILAAKLREWLDEILENDRRIT